MKVAVCAGEKSGDTLGHDLLKDLKKNNDSITVIGVGGSMMESLGLDSFFPISDISYMGLIDPILNLRKILKRRKQLINFLKKEKPDVFIGIDSPSFNSGVCKALRKETNIKTIQYVCPQFWAWRYDRVKKFNKLYHLIFSLFPFESDLLKKHKVNFSYVGHHLAKSLPLDINIEAIKNDFNLPKQKKVIAILPGSRKSEIKYHEGPLIDFINLYKKDNEDTEIVLALNKLEDMPKNFIEIKDKIKIVFGETQKALSMADVAVVASGTATLEAAILAKPMVVIYKSNLISNFILSNFFLKSKYISLPNILSQSEIVPELRQNKVTGLEILSKVNSVFLSESKIINQLSSLKDNLSVNDSAKFSRAIKKLILE
ncbi:MAG: lipid-A-disaccharide synthase [Gammaproteobacteria bacterium]|nr:MAG: lipid-A-disaccharide synthase [Gammaproteobacteria bacterium]